MKKEPSVLNGVIIGAIIYIALSVILILIPKFVYILYNCIIGLAVGVVISFGINRKRHKKLALPFMVLIFPLIFFIFIIINLTNDCNYDYLYVALGSFMLRYILTFGLPLNIVTGFLVKKFLSYAREDIRENKFFIMTILYSLIIFLTINLTRFCFGIMIIKEYQYLLPGFFIYLFCITFFIICLITIVFHGIKQKNGMKTKHIFVLLILSLLFIYLFFAFNYYMLFLCNTMAFKHKNVVSLYDLTVNLKQCLHYWVDNEPFMVVTLPNGFVRSCCGPEPCWLNYFLVSIFKVFTFNKISEGNLIIIMNISSWITGFLITILSGWIVVKSICFSEGTVSPEKDYGPEKNIGRNILAFFFIILIFSGIGLFVMWQLLQNPLWRIIIVPVVKY